MKEIKRIKIEKEVIDYIQARYEDYISKQDLLSMIFDIHKQDEDGSIVKSAPFKTYEKEFAEAKLKYQTAMDEISEKYIPIEYKTSSYSFTILFDENEIVISEY